MANTKAQERLDQEWEQRTLCSDESCIGVIGPDGKCKECGLKYEGPLPDNFGDASKVEATDQALDVDDADPDDHDAAASASPGSDDEWEQRTLCSDESCIGVIGPDGKCKECGKPYAP